MAMDRWIYKFPLRLKSVFQRDRAEQELAEELQYHLERRTDELVAGGTTPNEARATATREMDGLEQQKELCRDARKVNFIEDLVQDLRYGVRTLRRTPVLVLVIVVSLALGIGANAAIFGVMNAVLLKMLPVQEPERLVLMEWSTTEWPEKYVETMEGSNWKDPGTGRDTTFSSSLDAYQRLKANNHVFSDVFGFAANGYRVNVGLQGRAEAGDAQAVSGNYFQGLGVQPKLGRMFVEGDDADSATPVAVASYKFYQTKLGGQERVIGSTITVNGARVTIIGVAPPEFFGVVPGNMPDLWIPLSLYIQQMKQTQDFDLRMPKAWWIGVVGRLRPGVSAEQAKAETTVLFRQSLEAVAPVDPNDQTTPRFEMEMLGKGLNNLRDQFSTSLRLLMGMVGVVLLIACANVAGLLLTRATVRQREIAIRVSLGAGRRRIVRQLLTESVLLALIGGAAGLMVMKWTSEALVGLLSSGRSPIYLPVAVDGRVLAFTLAVSVLCGVAFGLAPTLTATRVDVLPVLKEGARTTRGARPWFKSGKLLVSGQVAMCVLLTACAGLLLGTLQKLQKEKLGFAKENLVTFQVAPGLNGYSGPRLLNYYEELQRRIERIPGVRAATFSLNGPIGSGASTTRGWAPGYGSDENRLTLYRHIIGPKYFETLGVPVLMGRTLNERDTLKAPRVMLVNQAAVKQLFHGQNPLGHRVDFGDKAKPMEVEVVGVVADAKYETVRDEPPPTVYASYLQRENVLAGLEFQVRTGGDPGAVFNDIRRAVLELDEAVPAVGMRTEEQVLEQHLFLERTFAALSSAFAMLAMLLACIGLYGTVGYSVAQRTNEIGIRMALGAERERILLMMLRDTAIMVGAGLMAGLALAAMTTRYLTAQLFGVSPLEPRIILVAAIAVIVATTVAGFIPARRATKVDPMVALRYE